MSIFAYIKKVKIAISLLAMTAILLLPLLPFNSMQTDTITELENNGHVPWSEAENDKYYVIDSELMYDNIIYKRINERYYDVPEENWEKGQKMVRLAYSVSDIEADGDTNNPGIIGDYVFRNKSKEYLAAVWDRNSEAYDVYIDKSHMNSWIRYNNCLYINVSSKMPKETDIERFDFQPYKNNTFLIPANNKLTYLGRLTYCNRYAIPQNDIETNDYFLEGNVYINDTGEKLYIMSEDGSRYNYQLEYIKYDVDSGFSYFNN